MPTWTKEQLEAYENRTSSQKHRTRPFVQKYEVHRQESKDQAALHNDGPKKEKVDGKVHPKFRVTIILRYADRRRRDIDGSASTILDCLVTATRRFAAMDTRTPPAKQ